MMKPDKGSINFLNKKLNLPASGNEQDWAIELSNYEKIEGFMKFLSSEVWRAPIKYSVMCLIISSYEDMLYEKADEGNIIWNQIEDLLREDRALYADILTYWTLPEENDKSNWFKITPLMRDYEERIINEK